MSQIKVRLEKTRVWAGKVQVGWVTPSEQDDFTWGFSGRSEALDGQPMGRSSTEALALGRVARALQGWLGAMGLEVDVGVEEKVPDPSPAKKKARARSLI